MKIRKLNARAVRVPINRPPITASGVISEAPIVIIDIETDRGIVGSSYIFALSPLMLEATHACVVALAGVVVGEPLEPVALNEKLRQRFALSDTRGMLGQALSGIDMAAWDAVGKAQELPLAKLLGGDAAPVRAYNSCGLWIDKPEALLVQLDDLLDSRDFSGIKIRLGRKDFSEDLRAVRLVRKNLPDNVALMCDFNQSLNMEEAMRRCKALDDEGLYWIEDPVRHDNYLGVAEITRATETPVQIGEYLCSVFELQRAIAAGAADFFMPDIQQIGGVTGWMRASAIAHSHDVPISNHLFPEFSSHLMSVAPTRHWLEYVDWASPLLEFPVEIHSGSAVISDRYGSGIVWNENAVEKYAV